jgi:SAM-dependent methyltransferase
LSKSPGQDYDSFPRYLAAKKTVDDRALNQQVWVRLAEELASVGNTGRLKILEVGAGTGTMVTRILERGLIDRAYYTALDATPENIEFARRNVPAWAEVAGFEVETTPGSEIQIQRDGVHFFLDLIAEDLYRFLPVAGNTESWDLLIAHAFLDLVDLDRALPLLLNAVRPGGLVYFTINFDRLTLFEPVTDPIFEAELMAAYHQTMDERIIAGNRSGDSRTGRRLFEALERYQVDVLAAGSSDWVVFPGPDGYPGDEAYFLHFIIETVHGALAGHPAVDPEPLADWVARRHEQVDNQALRLIVHQLDYLGRKRI